ncbi:MAG: MFS transporter [Kiloniellales bacterium]
MRAPIIVTFLSFIGFAVVYPVLPFQALALGASAQGVTALLVVEPLVAALLAPLVGSLSDRIGRRPVVLLLLALALPAYLLLAMADALWLLFASRLLAGASTAVSPVIQAYLADVTSKDDRILGMAGVNAAFCLAFIVGPVITTTALGPDGTDYATTALAGAAAALAAVLLAGVCLAEPRRTLAAEPAEAAKPANRPGRERPFAALVRAGCLLPVLALSILGLVYAAMDTTLGLWFDETSGWGARELSFAFAIAGAAAFIALCVIRRLTAPLGEAAAAAVCAIAMGLGFLALLLAGGWIGLASAMALLGAGMAVGTSCLQSLISKAAPADSQGLVLGQADALFTASSIVGPLAAGFAFEQLHVASPYAAAAVLSLLAALLLARNARASETTPASQPEQG